MLEDYIDVLDENWNIALHKYFLRGPIKEYQDALQRPYQSHLATDGNYPLLNANLSAAVVEAGIDIRVPGLLERLALDDLALFDWFNTKTYETPALGYRSKPIEHVMRLIDTRHGSQVASILAADLPNLKISLLPIEGISVYSALAKVQHGWAETLRQSQARVVNISYAFGRSIPDCNAFFGPLLEEFKDVLFVTAVGNSSGHNPYGDCPIGLQDKYPNLLTVAGSYGAGLHQESNYGKETSMVAAPYIAYPVEVTEGMALKPGQVIVVSGTSLSAPRVGNAALRLLARNPNLKSAELISILMSHCKDQGLDVACGGEIDFEALEGYRPAGSNLVF